MDTDVDHISIAITVVVMAKCDIKIRTFKKKDAMNLNKIEDSA